MSTIIESSSPSCRRCASHNCSVFAECDNNLLRLLDSVKSCKEYNAGELIFSEREESEGVYCIYKGKAILIKSSEDGKREVAIQEVGEGAIIGVRGVVSEQYRLVTARALTEFGACFIPKDAFLDLTRNNATVATKVMQQICETIRALGLTAGGDNYFCE